ncbi:uncharacterized protein C6orf226 homolog [Falco naumanni]|uniref:uncharacterized protein C6orf226 homolog n=1 Tax=Falco naumanni TaxID=148594 RepID=UPI001ADEB4DF|nr:uncharacterized protein C6orf226 homolog [Falco naumanni]
MEQEQEQAAAPAPALAEVLRLVQSGQEPPGVRRPHVSPTGDSPTASRLPPPLKPWERPPHGSAHSCSQCSENKEPPPLDPAAPWEQ